MRRLSLVAAIVLATMAFSTAPARAAGPAVADPPTPLSLAQAISVATSTAPAVQLAALRASEAESRRGQARAALLPTLSGTALALERTYSYKAMGLSLGNIPGIHIPNLIGPVDQVDARVRATQALFDAASWVRLRSAGLGVDAGRADERATAEGAAQVAAAAYVRAARAAAVVAAREADLGLARQLTALADDQMKAGTAARIDVVRARTQEAAARGALLVAQNQAARAAIDLARALGVDPAARFRLSDTLSSTIGSSTAPAEPGAAVALALEQRPDLTAERARRAVARAAKRAIQAERLPRLDLSADYGLSGDHWGSSVATRAASLAVSMPIFDGLRREGRIAEQDAVAREADVRERDLRRQVAAEVEGAALDLSSGLEQERVAMERLRLADEELAQARERFTSGVAGNIEIINAQASLIRARDAVIDARGAVAGARILLARAVGVARTAH